MKTKIIRIVRGLLIIVLVLAAPASMFLTGSIFLAMREEFPDEAWVVLAVGILVVLLVAAGCIAEVRSLLRSEPKPNVRGALVFLVVIGLIAGLVYGLGRLVAGILP